MADAPAGAARDPLPRISHAGGRLNGDIYTNSLEGLARTHKAGFRFFELDFSPTSDRHWVCVHDWPKFFRFAGRQTPSWNYRPDLDEFLTLRRQMSFTPCTLDELSSWLARHPEAHIVTDTKYENSQLLGVIAKRIAKDKVIPQVYHPDRIAAVRALGFKDVILTVYKLDWPNDRIIREIGGKVLFALTMPKTRVLSGLALRAAKGGHRTYTHSINGCFKFKLFRLLGVEEVYTADLGLRDCI